jgi:hypothetical protein
MHAMTKRDDDLLFVELVNQQLREQLELILYLTLAIKQKWHHADKYELRKKLLENLFDWNVETSRNEISENLVSDFLLKPVKSNISSLKIKYLKPTLI